MTRFLTAWIFGARRCKRKVMVLLSDDDDNASGTTRKEGLRTAETSNAVIHAIGSIEEGSRDANPRLRKELTSAGGGEAFRPRNPAGIGKALDQIARDIRHTYTVGYTSTNTARLVVRSRTGHRAAASIALSR